MILRSYFVLIFLSLIVLISYAFNLVSRRWKFPAVLFLLGLGVLLRYVSVYFNFELNNIQPYLELFGIVGLILIVFEAALDIKINPSSISTVKKSLEVASLVLILSIAAIASLFHFWLAVGWRVAFINAIPPAVISSAIVIPSIGHLSPKKKDFLIYESTLSDILGILFFNFMLTHAAARLSSVFHFAGSLVVTALVSLVSAIFLLYLVTRIKDHVKIFIILSVMILIYSFGKLFHLSPLLLIFIFGLLLSNYEYFFKKRIGFIKDGSILQDFAEFKLVVSESSFVIRTFFFVMFGYSIDVSILSDRDVLIVGSLVSAILILARYVYLKFFAKVDLMPELFVAPKGLVSILLFYSIPAYAMIPSIGRGVLFFVICVSSLLMAAALFDDHRKNNSRVTFAS